MKVITGFWGRDIRWVAQQLVEAAAESSDGAARCRFNGVTVVARRASTPEALVSQWRRKFEAKSKKYSRTDKAKAEASRWAEYEASVQAKHDELMQQLLTLDFNYDVNVIDWLCEYQNPSDFKPVTNRDPQKVVKIFAEHGYHPLAGADDFDENDRNVMADIIIGQALHGLADFGSIHQVIHHFAEEWKKKFVTIH